MADEKRMVDINKFPLLPSRLDGDMSEYERGYLDAQANLNLLPIVDAIPLTADELRYLINDTIAYIWRLEKRGCDKPEFGYDRRKALLEKLKQFQKEHFPEKVCSCGERRSE